MMRFKCLRMVNSHGVQGRGERPLRAGGGSGEECGTTLPRSCRLPPRDGHFRSPKTKSSSRNQIHLRLQALTRRPPGRRLRFQPPWKHCGSKRGRSPSYRFENGLRQSGSASRRRPSGQTHRSKTSRTCCRIFAESIAPSMRFCDVTSRSPLAFSRPFGSRSIALYHSSFLSHLLE